VGVYAGSLQHHIQIRTSDAFTNANAVADFSAQFAVLLPQMYNDCGYNELLVAEHGSDIRNPVPGWTIMVGTQPGAQPDTEEPLTLGARGRSPDGRKVRLFLWGQLFTRTSNWLFTPGAGTVYKTFLDILNAAPNTFLTISGVRAVWKPNYTIQYNDHAVKRERP
jgi:hypothetical protein